MRPCRRLSRVRRQLEQLAAIAEARAAAAADPRPAPSWRPLSESETAALIDPELLAALAATAGEIT